MQHPNTHQNVVVKKECHSRVSLSGIYHVLSRCRYKISVILNLIQALQHLPLLFINNLRGRCQIKFGMTPNWITTRGFTLIELLVVVLIIGILAAVAVPLYQKVVERSKATEALSMLSSIAKAYQTHYLANGQYAEKFDELDVDIPFSGTTKFYNLATDTKSNKDWSFQISNSSEYVSVFVARISGKYKGAGFSFSFKNPSFTDIKQLKCFERKDEANILFDTTLPGGAYCEQVMQAKKAGEDQYARAYILP